MNNQEIIEQGYLEAYLTGDLSADETADLEKQLSNPEVQSEFLKVQKRLEFLAFGGAILPEEKIKLTLINKILRRKQSKNKQPNYLIAASISLAILSSLAAVVFYNRYKSVENELSDLVSQNSLLNNDVQQVNQEMDRMKNDLTVLINPAYTRVVMNSTQDGLVQQAVIYFNPSEQKVYLNSSTLPELTEDQEYQLWALIDGQPVDAGTFDVLKDRFQQMGEFDRVDAFAVTIEPKGGSENPTLEAMQVYGEV